jgi:hypothetical protein
VLINTLLAGLCISGDLIAHASFRLMRNAVGMREGAGVFATLASLRFVDSTANRIYREASVAVSSFQNFCAEEMLAHSFSECASWMFGPKEIMSRPG